MAIETHGQQQAEPSVEQESLIPADLLDRIIDQGQVGQNVEEKKQGREWIEAYLTQVVKNEISRKPEIDQEINDKIAELDAAITEQLNHILHAPEFQRLEASWRGLRYLVDQTETGESLKVKVMNVAKDELYKDLKDSDFDQSQLFRKIYEEEFGVLGGHPFGALIGDYYFGRNSPDLEVLEKMSNVAAAAHAPFISAASAEMFGWHSFTELANRPDLSKIFESAHYTRWSAFRQSEDSRFVGLTLPHILLREPYGKETDPVDAFDFEEDVTGTEHDKYLWGNSAYAFAGRLTNAYAQYEWCAAIRGVQGGGLVEDLPMHKFPTDDGDVALKCPTELAITDRREAEFSRLGFIPLCHEKRSNRAVFFGAQSCNRPPKYLDANANANAKLSSQLQYMMAVSRFAHFLKVMMRDYVGAFMSRDDCEGFLNRWISNYVLLDDSANQDQKARFPLREARIEVAEIPGKPGSYNAIAFLRPHFQLEELAVSLRLVAKLPTPKG